MDTIFKLSVLLKLQDQVSGGLDGIAEKADAADMSLGSIKKTILGLTVALVALAAAWTSVGVAQAKAFGEYESKIEAAAFFSGANPAEKAALDQTAFKAGMETEWDPGETAGGMQTLAAQGRNAVEQISMLPNVLDLATASFGQLNIEASASAVGGTLASYRMEAEAAGEVTDKLAKITMISNFQARDFAAGLSTAAAYGAQFSQKLGDVLVVMGLLRNANIDASVSSTAVRESLRRLGSDAGAQKALANMGVSAYDAQGKMRPLIDITMEVVEKTKDWTEAERNAAVVKAYGARGLAAFNAIAQASVKVTDEYGERTLKGADALAYYRDQMDNASGSAAELREKMLGTYQGVSKLLDGSLKNLGIAFGKAWSRSLKPLKQDLVPSINNLTKGFQALSPAAQDFIVLLPGITAGVAAVSAVLYGLAAAMGVVNAAMLLNPITWVILAIAGLGVAVTGLIVYWDRAMSHLADAMDKWLIGPIARALEYLDKLFAGLMRFIGITPDRDKMDYSRRFTPAPDAPFVPEWSEYDPDMEYAFMAENQDIADESVAPATKGSTGTKRATGVGVLSEGEKYDVKIEMNGDLYVMAEDVMEARKTSDAFVEWLFGAAEGVGV